MTTRTMPARTAPPPVAGAPRRDVELILARAHLRLGSLALARVELETLAGLGRLDATGLVDLAEVRWRTGDLGGAGEAAGAALRLDERQPVALIIAAEAAAAIGRPSESRRLAAKAVECLTDPIDVVFAGMPRSGAWPADAAEPPPTAGTLFHQERIETAESARSGDEHGDRRPATIGAAGTTSTIGAAGAGETTPGGAGGAAGAAAAMTLGFWDGDDQEDPAAGELPDPAHELDAGRAALVAGKHDEAGLRLGIALRLAPALAPAILEATEGARSPAITILRGDAYRLAGHETEARRAYALAGHGGLPDRRHRSRRTHDTAVEATPVAAFDEEATAPARRDRTPKAAHAAETPETPEAVETAPAETAPAETDRTPDDAPA